MNKKKRIAIIGAGGHGKVVGEIALLNQYDVIHFFDDNVNHIQNFPFTIIGNLKFLKKHKIDYDFAFVAIGDNKKRHDLTVWLTENNIKITSLKHPKSIISKFSFLEGKGICIMANAVVNAGTSIKDGVIINTSASVDHDCLIEDFAHISPNCTLSGSIKIGKFTHLGSGTSVHPGTIIGSNVKTAIGSKIFKNISNNKIYKT